MKTKFKPLLLALVLGMFMLALVGCSKSNSSDGSSASNSTGKKPPTNQEYYTYLNDKYNQYLKGNNNNKDYDIFVDNFTYNGTYDEFITGYNKSYADTKTNLEAFKKDLETNVVKGNAEVDKINQNMITSIDKAIISVDEYNGSFTDKTKDYATLSKDEVIKGLRTIGRAPHEARLELDKLVNDAKNSLGIK